MINYTKFFLLTILVTVCGVTIAETPIEDNEYVIFYHHDVLGSPVAVSDGKGRVLWYEDTDPYGEGLGRNSSDVITSVGNPIVESADNRMGYAGHEKDNNSGLTYMKARHYDPMIGRFYSNDPVGSSPSSPVQFNRYSYVSGNPYGYVDPDGKERVGVTLVGRYATGLGSGFKFEISYDTESYEIGSSASVGVYYGVHGSVGGAIFSEASTTKGDQSTIGIEAVVEADLQPRTSGVIADVGLGANIVATIFKAEADLIDGGVTIEGPSSNSTINARANKAKIINSDNTRTELGWGATGGASVGVTMTSEGNFSLSNAWNNFSSSVSSFFSNDDTNN